MIFKLLPVECLIKSIKKERKLITHQILLSGRWRFRWGPVCAAWGKAPNSPTVLPRGEKRIVWKYGTCTSLRNPFSEPKTWVVYWHAWVSVGKQVRCLGFAISGPRFLRCTISFCLPQVRHDWLDLRVPIWDQDMEFLPGSEKIVTCTGHHQVVAGKDTRALQLLPKAFYSWSVGFGLAITTLDNSQLALLLK